MKEVFGPRYQPGINNGRAIVEFDEYKFYRFKVIEITSPKEVCSHFSFVHPHYANNYQRIYFSMDKTLMLERLQNQRVILYERGEVQLSSSDIKWKIKKIINDFSTDISEFSYNNYLFSPNFKYYMDFDKSENIFLIRRTDEQTAFVKIP